MRGTQVGRRTNKQKADRHVRLYYWMLESAAWRDLDAFERAIYLLLAERFNGLNNGDIPLSCREIAKALKISKDTANRKLGGLDRRGFIKVAQQSGFNLKENKGRARRWRLTEHNTRTGKDRANGFIEEGSASKDFMRWKPDSRSDRGDTGDLTGLF